MPDSTQIDHSQYLDADLTDTSAAAPDPAAAAPEPQASAAAALQVLAPSTVPCCRQVAMPGNYNDCAPCKTPLEWIMCMYCSSFPLMVCSNAKSRVLL